MLTIVRFSDYGFEEIKAKHASLESRLGSILTKDFAIILRALSLEEWYAFRVELVVLGVVSSIPGFKEGVTFDTCENLNSQTGVVWPYNYLPEDESWQVLEIRLGTGALADRLDFLQPQVRGARFAGIYSTISSFLEIPYESSETSHLVVIAPTLARCRIDSFNLDSKELEITTEIHSKLSNCQLIVFVKKNGNRPGQGRPLSLRKSISLDAIKQTKLENGFQLIPSKVTLPDFSGEEELELVIMTENISLFDITEPPGKYSRKNVESRIRLADAGHVPEQSGSSSSSPDPRKVFVVHGRNLEARDAIFAFLHSIGLTPLEWSQAVLATSKPNPYVGEVLDAAFSIAGAVLVLMTPDDEARLRSPFRKADDTIDETQLSAQARPNVLFEAGMAMGRNPDRTVLVELGRLRPFSDIGGRHVIKLNGSTQRRQELAQRLRSANCPVDLSGTEWHSAGISQLSRQQQKMMNLILKRFWGLHR